VHEAVVAERVIGIGVLALLLGILGTLGITATIREGAVVLASGDSPAESFEALVAGQLHPAYSEYSKSAVLDACYATMGSTYAQAQPTPRWTALNEACRDIARGIIREVPDHAYGWLVLAQAAAGLGDAEALNAALVASRKDAPNEVWLASRRATLAQAHAAELSASAAAAYDADLRLLVSSKTGLRAVAQRYVEQPDFRARITAIVEHMSAEDQRRFVAGIHAAAPTDEHP
jgi:hypothetical protein